MPQILISITKDTVWTEVLKTAEYTGLKMIPTTENSDDYERISITDEDRASLQRFWEEAVSVANEQLKEMIVSASDLAANYQAILQVSKSYDTVLNASVRSAIQSYLISAIVARWYKFTNKAEAAGYFAEAATMLADARRKLYSRRRPSRPGREDSTDKPLKPETDDTSEDSDNQE